MSASSSRWLAAAVLQRPRVWRTAMGILHDPDSAEDVAQEVFLRWHRSRPEFAHERQLTSWMHRVTVNLCRDHLRSRKRHAGSVDPEDAGLAADADPARDLARLRTRAALEDALARLGPEQSRAIRMRYLDGLPYPEIARRTHTSVGTVASRIFRGLKRLGEHVEPTHLEILK